ncbi:hypothetical protein [Eleftheria terrae]|uniref:hypothetical protein n=1 Tax=Eleftheria terrae TaxID=1597781 RepID=UPI00263AC1D0|nr:hypothetical protein [Eleftheria terrae]WKB54611.1 hypothetical protein N7L95_09625 [Eleftheria terrae]
MGTVYRKTEKGQSEIATRQNRLAPKFRSGLIVVDGKRNEHELMRLIPNHPEEVLQTLLAEGYIEIIGLAAHRPAANRPREEDSGPPSQPFRVSQPPGGRSLELLRVQAVRFMSEQLGPLGDSLAMRMEKSRSWEELQPLLVTAHRIVADNRGGATAEAFKAAFLESGT